MLRQMVLEAILLRLQHVHDEDTCHRVELRHSARRVLTSKLDVVLQLRLGSTWPKRDNASVRKLVSEHVGLGQNRLLVFCGAIEPCLQVADALDDVWPTLEP